MMATNISNSLNEMWDPAWNVVVGKLIYLTIDFTFCGYAFRFHWFWHNNYKGYSIVISKDYNCGEWATFQSNSAVLSSDTTWAQNVQSYINENKGSWAGTLVQFPPNIWQAVCQIAGWAENREALTNTYSAVGFQGEIGESVSIWAYRFCHD